MTDSKPKRGAWNSKLGFVLAASGWIHQTEGMFTFAIAMVLLLTEAWILKKIWPRRWLARISRGTL